MPATSTSASRAPSLLGRLRTSIDTVYREAVKFGAVGALAFVVDIGVFNLLRVGGHGGLDDKPLTAKTISVFVATVVAWLGNRYWTFRHRRRASARREFVLFGIMNVGGLAIALACLGFSHYVLGQTSALADNIAGNVVGLALGTLFRFWAYRRLVFTEELSDLLDDEPGVSGSGADDSAGDASEPGTPDVAEAETTTQLEAQHATRPEPSSVP